MVTSILLINVERIKINDVAQQLAEIKGISEVYSSNLQKNPPFMRD